MADSMHEERESRLRQYAITMLIRTLCVVGMVVVRGPMIWVFAAGAIVLPWIAVVFANHLRQRRRGKLTSPEERPLVVTRASVNQEAWRDAAQSQQQQRQEHNDEFR
ncbi:MULTISPECIES: DUF3099 domain-containing protein [Gulosibacter]|uniref:DUF3099 domain-containing protein n=1 Tax=Gulosibacter TaxID=256818 RepID=UPI001919C377|nr:DUF3099 domain-containing protein [Gulosibacter hominis]